MPNIQKKNNKIKPNFLFNFETLLIINFNIKKELGNVQKYSSTLLMLKSLKKAYLKSCLNIVV